MRWCRAGALDIPAQVGIYRPGELAMRVYGFSFLAVILN